jgi:hypothetical protein
MGRLAALSTLPLLKCTQCLKPSRNPISRYVQLARKLGSAHLERLQYFGEMLARGNRDAQSPLQQPTESRVVLHEPIDQFSTARRFSS